MLEYTQDFASQTFAPSQIMFFYVNDINKFVTDALQMFDTKTKHAAIFSA